MGGGGRGRKGDKGDPGTAACLIPVTYAQLLALIAANGFEAGCFYLITDFRTRETIPNTTDIILGPTEPIIVQAVSTNAIDETNVLSTVFEQDQIHYEVINTTTSSDDRGRIYYRKDDRINVSAGYDWRVIKFRRWWSGEDDLGLSFTAGTFVKGEIVTGGTSGATGTITSVNGIGKLLVSGIVGIFVLGETITGGTSGATATIASIFKRYTALTAGSAPDPLDFNDYYTFNNSPSASACVQTVLEQISDFGISDLGAPSDKLNNFILFASCLDNLFEHDNFNSTIFADLIADNRTQPAFFENIAVGKLFIGNRFEPVTVFNTFGEDFQFNFFGFNTLFNFFGDGCTRNLFGDDCVGNTVQNIFRNNIFGSGFFGNSIDDTCQSNNVKTQFSNNFISKFFQSNNIGDEFKDNGTALTPIGQSFNSNEIGNNFNGNATIGASFISNVIDDDFTINTVGESFNRNQIGVNYSNNTLGDNFQANQIKNFFHDNIIGNVFTGNTIGNDFGQNNIDDGFQNNQIGNSFFGKLSTVILAYSGLAGAFTTGEVVTGGISGAIGTVAQNSASGASGSVILTGVVGTFVAGETITGGTSGATATIALIVFGNLIRGQFIGNVIINNFQSNLINYITGTGFNDNEIFNDFQTNIVGKTGETFRKNHIEAGLHALASVNGFDFAASVFVYANHTFQIKLTDDGATYLGYYYVTTVPPVVTILSAVPNA